MQLSELIQFTPPKIKRYKSGIYIEYYCRNPFTNKLERQIHKGNKVVKSASTKREGLMLLECYCVELHAKLKSGWRPFQAISNTVRTLTPLHQALNKFIADKSIDLRPDSIRTYQTTVNKLINYTRPDFTCSECSSLWAIQYVETLTGIAPRTYNSNVKNCKIVFEWLKSKQYISDNPFSGIKTKKTYEKKRGIIPKDIRDRITEYLKKNKPQMLLYLHLLYSSLIRPKEIHSIRIKDINIQKKYIRIDGEVAKNHKERFAPITPDIVDMLVPYANTPNNYYLFSSRLLPGSKPISKKMAYKYWVKMKKDLDIENEELQLYSFRDSGIFDMLKSGIDDLSVMQAADHSNLQITSIYAKHTDTHLQEKLYTSAPKF